MGASTFAEFATGKTAQEAFNNAVEEAEYEYGHSGYTGTVAEKIEFVIIGKCLMQEAEDKAYQLIDDCDSRIDDKWGPAGCFEITDQPDTWFFFGWASS